RAIPWILCTGKTRTELAPIRRAMGHRHPFIVENGGAILIPPGYFSAGLPSHRIVGGYQAIEIGLPYALLRMALREVADETGMSVKGFGDLDPVEISRLTGLSVEDAKRAMSREYDEPFLIEAPPENHPEALKRIESKGFRWTKGGQFYHVTGNNDKGRAVNILTDIYRRQHGRILTIGIGDALNDLPLLAAVDRPILVRKPDGSYDEAIALPDLERADGIGPAGWNRSVLGLLAGYK
ncbi:MAG TPA: HAD-IIB family hydrolase, partial [Nitrospiria bacterium]